MSNILPPLQPVTGRNLKIERNSEDIWSIKATLFEVNRDGPICILVPGFDSRGRNSDDNMELTKALIARNVSVVTYDYSGAYNVANKADRGTFDTYVSDTRALARHFHDRAHVLVSKSYGINVAFASADATETKGIVSTIPAPDVIGRDMVAYLKKKGMLSQALMKVVMEKRGYFLLRTTEMKADGEEPVKVSQRIFTSGAQPHNQLDAIVQRNDSRPPVVLVPNNRDANFMNESNVADWAALFTRAGYSCRHVLAQGDRHAYTADTVTKSADAAAELALAQ